MNILLVGPIGSGKTTHAKLLAESLGLCVLRTGDLVRKKAQDNDDEGTACRDALATGEIVSDQIVADLVQKELADCPQGFVSDGYPRRMTQLEVFDPKVDIVFLLEVPEAALEERLSKRGRADDTPEIIKKRVAVYYQETEPLVHFYEQQNRLIVINGEGPIEEVAEDIKSHIKKDV